jgi:hypothetical protein
MSFRITEDMVQHAFDILRSPEHAKARAMFTHSEKRLKRVLAQQMLDSKAGSATAKEMEALASGSYGVELQKFKAVSEHYYRLQDEREAASAIIEGWRTQQSDLRAAGRVG